MSFNMNYAIEFSGDGQEFRFRCANVEDSPFRDCDCLVIKIIHSEGLWTGKFEAGPGGVTGVFGTPDENTMCVINKGQGYWVPVLSPKDFECIPSIPIKEMFEAFESELIIFKDFVSLVAYDEKGIRWQTPRLSYDGITIENVNSQTISGLVWDGPSCSDIRFTLFLENGTYVGGCDSLRDEGTDKPL